MLGTKTMLRLLKVLLDNPLYEFKEIELIQKAKTGKGSASEAIKELIKERILLEKRVGKIRVIYLNLQNKKVFLLKNFFDYEKIIDLSKSKLASILLFRDRIKEKSELVIVFGSCITKTVTEKSDIDIMVVSNKIDEVNKERKKIEELFGERINLHDYVKNEIKMSDMFMKNVLLNGVLFYGYDLGSELFSKIKEKKDLERLFFFNERIKASLRNYSNKDGKTAKEILDRTLEQVIFYLLSEREINYVSKKDAEEAIKKLPEGKIIQKINKSSLKEKIILSEKFILDILKDKVISNVK